MVTIANTDFTSSYLLAPILAVSTKEQLATIAKALDLYVSLNIKKQDMASRLAGEMLSNPLEIISRLGKTELQLLDEFVKAGPNAYIIRKERKTEYKLQKWRLVLTCEKDRQWHMIMPDCVREALSQDYEFYLDLAMKGIKGPSMKDLRMTQFLNSLGIGKNKKE